MPKFPGDVDELISAGVMGLILAHQSYDGRASMFTWSYWRVYAEMQQASRVMLRARGGEEYVDSEIRSQSNDFEEMIEILPDRHKKYFRLHYVSNYSMSEISVMEGCSKQWISKTIQEGLRWLSANL